LARKASSHIDWLLRQGGEALALDAANRIVVDDASWRAAVERVPVSPGLVVYLTDAQAHRDMRVTPERIRTDQWLGNQVTVAGRAGFELLDGHCFDASPDSALMFRLPPGDSSAYSLAAGARFQSAGYSLDIERARRLLGDEVPEALAPLLDPGRRDGGLIAVSASPAMRGLASHLFSRGLNGPLRRLMMEGAVVHLLALQASAVGRAAKNARQAPLSPRERKQVRAARERLLHDMRRPPSLGELADAVGLSEKRLNAGFRQEFGGTVFEVLRNERLEHARLAFRQGEASLKEVAFRVGYNHTTNFINAFRARFGEPPGRFLVSRRRSRRRAPRLAAPAD
jgi:AraC-like DNA-binding protein